MTGITAMLGGCLVAGFIFFITKERRQYTRQCLFHLTMSFKMASKYDRIYPGNTIDETAIIYDGVQMGTGNFIGPYCIIGGPAEKHGYFNVTGRVIIGNNNTFAKQVTIDSGTTDVTEISNGCTFLKNSHVGHDAHIDDEVTLSCNVCIGGHTVVMHRTNFGLGAVAHQRLVIPQRCMIGMNTTITKRTQMQAGMKYVGSPARCIGENVRL